VEIDMRSGKFLILFVSGILITSPACENKGSSASAPVAAISGKTPAESQTIEKNIKDMDSDMDSNNNPNRASPKTSADFINFSFQPKNSKGASETVTQSFTSKNDAWVICDISDDGTFSLSAGNAPQASEDVRISAPNFPRKSNLEFVVEAKWDFIKTPFESHAANQNPARNLSATYESVCKHTVTFDGAIINGRLNCEKLADAESVRIDTVKGSYSCRPGRASIFSYVYTDSYTGLSWSKPLWGGFTNTCVNHDGKYDRSKCAFEKNDKNDSRHVDPNESEAERACKVMHARLPTLHEFQDLMRGFDHEGAESEVPQLTKKKGQSEFNAVFGDFHTEAFWTSSVEENGFGIAIVYPGLRGNAYYHDGYRNMTDFGVMCVKSK
jgi:hypothetical protein